MTGLKYFFTKYGDVYSGWEYPEINFPNYRIVIQGTKRQDYQKFSDQDKTLDIINEHGWALANNIVYDTLDGDLYIPPETKRYESDSWFHSYERKVMFIFGAGASANCVYGSDINEFEYDDLRPPLGPALFNKRFKNYYNKYKGVKQSLPLLQVDNPDVEELFEREWKNISKENNEAVLKRHINIQYYLQEVLKEVSKKVIDDYYATNLYAKLANKLQKIYAGSVSNDYNRHSSKKFAFISFNQDTILDTILSEQFNQSLASMDDYVNINEKPFCLFKPHGSWNWGWKFPNPSKFNGKTADWLFENNINHFQLYYQLLGDHNNMIDWTNIFGIERSINPHHLGKHTIDKSLLKIISNDDDLNNYYPGLLLPYRDKDEFTMPLRHFQNMREYLTHIETLVIIGWKGNEDAFNKLLQKKAKQLKKVIIADPQHQIVEYNLKELFLQRNIKPIIYNDFEDFVINGIDKELAEQFQNSNTN